MVVGQAPGRVAQESGLPWNDASGAKLFEWLGVTEHQFRDPDLFALLPMDFYYPGKGTTGDLPPRKDFAPRWHPPLLDLMPKIELTILIGGYAQKYYLADKVKKNLTETRPRLSRVPAGHDSAGAPLTAELPLADPQPMVRHRGAPCSSNVGCVGPGAVDRGRAMKETFRWERSW